MKNTDLHTHSYYSDGQISPKKLVKLAKKRGIKNLALTDHDSVEGVKEAIKEGKKIGVRVIPGVEIRAKKGEVLGYFVDFENKELNKILKIKRRKVQEGVKDWCRKLKEGGYNISFKEIQEKFPKSKNNINEFYPIYLLYKKGYGKMLEIAEKLRKENLRGKKIKEISVIKAIRLIKKAGGVPVLAHPWIDEDVLKEKNFKRYVRAGLRGIELNNGDRSPWRKRKHIKRIRRLAKKYKLILTSGSDYHGLELVEEMPGNHKLGENNCDEKVVKKLEELAKKCQKN